VHNVERSRFRGRRATFVTDSVHNVAWFAEPRLRSTLFGDGANTVAWRADLRDRSTFFAPATDLPPHPAELPFSVSSPRRRSGTHPQHPRVVP
jgi:hypothetical protein